MKIQKNKIRTTALSVILGLGAAVFAQEANDGFSVPLNENFSKSGKSSSAAPAAAAAQKSKSPLKQGLWIETYGDAVSLIRNISDGTKKGYELDSFHFASEANWWFWGDINDYFHLDAEVSVWDFDKTLYKANSYGANVPDISWGDGLQSLAEMPFSFIKHGAGENGPGTFNKLAFNLDTPFVEARFGYGNLKENGMTEFTGIYSVIDRWDDVGDGYTELKNGWGLQNFGKFRINALAALSQMKDTYGTYDYLDVKYSDKAEIAFTFGSTTTEEQLFFYNRTNKNAVSAYAAVTPDSRLKLEGHYLGTFGTDVDLNGASSAVAARAGWSDDTWSVRLKQSFAGVNVDSIWGSDGQNYDDINADTATTQLDLWKDFGKFAIGLDQGVTFNDSDNLSEGLMHLRSEPYADVNLTSILGKEITIGAYGIFGFDRLAKETSEGREFISSIEEIGLEIKTGKLAEKLQSLVFDYAASVTYDDWTGGNGYKRNTTYHSIMANAQLTERFNVHAGSIIRAVNESDDTNVPFGFAFGASIENLPLPGHPKLWAHFSYGMNPYEDNNYSMYRKDEAQKDWTHRTYLLNTLDGDMTTSHISVGLIWNL